MNREINKEYKLSQTLKWKIIDLISKVELTKEISKPDEKKFDRFYKDFFNCFIRFEKLVKEQINDRTMWNSRLKEIKDLVTNFEDDIRKLLREFGDNDSSDDDIEVVDDPLEREELKYQNKLMDKSIGIVKGMQSLGGGVIENLREQREILKHAQKKVYDIGVAIGLSDKQITAIKKRLRLDSILVYSGMCIVILLIIFILYLKWT